MIVHIDKPRRCDVTMCWIDLPDDPYTDTFPFDCVPIAEAIKNASSIIRCRVCGRPAI